MTFPIVPMMRMPLWRARATGLLAAVAMALPGAHAAAQPPQAPAAGPDTAQVRQALQGLAVPFEANSGQFDERVAFVGRSFAGPVYVTRHGQIIYSLPAPRAEGEAGARQRGWSLSETLVGARVLKPYGVELAQAQIQRFAGTQSYQADTYRNICLGQAWPGIEVELAASAKGGANVGKLFHVAPHADAGRIQVRLAGAQSLRVGAGGELVMQTGHGEVAYTAPVAYQEAGGQRIEVPVKYALNAAGDGYGFELGMYDRTRALVIDPLLQSAYFGVAAKTTSTP